MNVQHDGYMQFASLLKVDMPSVFIFNTEVQILPVLIGSFFILLAIALSITKVVKKVCYFRCKKYVEARSALLDFVAKLDKLLSTCNYISDDIQTGLIEDFASAVMFFDRRPYTLPEDVLNALTKYAHIDEYIKNHKTEVEFEYRFFVPFRALKDGKSYVSWKQMDELLKDTAHIANLLRDRDSFFLDTTEEGLAQYDDAEDWRESSNSRFVSIELETCREFFDTIATYPLDEQQRKCCVVDDDSALVIAGAGSGKTSVIMSKVAYLIEKRNVEPSSILLISFTNKAADEMTERIMKCIGRHDIEAMTFHRFGLQIIKTFSAKRYDVADDEFLLKFIRSSLKGEGKVVDIDYIQKIVKYFAYYFNPDQSKKQYESLGDRLAGERTLNLETLKVMTAKQGDPITLSGEQVKSLEEAFIANFLFLNGIEYQYERRYTKEYQDDYQHRAYHPDFYLPDYDIYIEHYGVDEQGMPPPFLSAPDRLKYIASMEWKRNLHKEHKNKYIESFSWWNSKNILISELSKELANYNVVLKPRNIGEIWEKICENAKGQITEFERLIAAFISLFKSNGFTNAHFDELLSCRAATPHDTERQRTFLAIVRKIYNDYQKELAQEDCYDFSDMINRATDLVRNLPHGALPYKYIIVDEYQDASVGRMQLLKAVVDKTNAHIFCVGDDWQSIFRFAGSDINLFTDFSRYFGRSELMKIENTYRNSQELIDVMGQFIMMNPGQMHKKLKSNLHCKYPICLIVYPTEKNNVKTGVGIALDAVIKSIIKKASISGKDRVSILLLGRTKYDESLISCGTMLKRKGDKGKYEVVDAPKIFCQFLTVHKSKGLESDYVVLLNARNDLLGFPNLIADDPLLQLVLSKVEPYDYAEERRLFYVALTRTRNKVYLLVPEKAYSPFIDDLTELGVNAKHFVGSVATKDDISCPKCKKGRLIVRNGQRGEFMTCSNFPRCDYSIGGRYTSESKRCAICGNFMIVRHSNNVKTHWRRDKRSKFSSSRFWGCANYPHCTYTEPIVNPKSNGMF